MTVELRQLFTGLMTNVAESQAAGGALRVANNVVLRKPGALEQRQGFVPRTDVVSTQSYGWRNAIAYRGNVILEDVNGFHVDPALGFRTAPGGVIDWDNPTGTLYTPLGRFRPDSFASSQLRGNLYIPTAQGVVRFPIDAADDAALRLSGEPVQRVSFFPQGNLVVTGTSLPDGSQWAYRLVLRRTDDNGLIIRSRPSGARAFQNTNGAPGRPQLVIQVANNQNPNLRQDEVVEVYRGRTFVNTVEPDDEMALVKELGPGDFSLVGQATFFDDVPDSKRGAELYTSPSQLGYAYASDCPPAAAFSEVYRGCLFLGNTRGPARRVVSYVYTDATVTTSLAGNAFGSGRRDYTGTITAGSAVVAMSSVVGIEAGTLIEDTTDPTNPGGYVLSIAGLNVTLDTLQLVSGSGHALACLDAFQIGAAAKLSQVPDGLGYLTAFASNNAVGAYTITPPEPTFGTTVVFESIARGISTLTLNATHGREMGAKVPLVGEFGEPFAQDVYPNALQWSQPDEPENFPVVNYALIGDRNKHILGLAATRDALFIFKEDGIWRLSGTNGQWQIDPFDMTTFCLLPSSIKRLNNRIFLLSNKGVVAIDDANGVTPVSTPISDQVKRLVDNARQNFRTQGYYALTGVPGAAATIDDRNSEYMLLTGSTQLDLGTNLVLVYNELSDAWTTFSFDRTGTLGNGLVPTGLGLNELGEPMVLHFGGTRQSSYATNVVDGEVVPELHDGSAAVNITAYTSGQVTLLNPLPFGVTPDLDFLLSGGVLFPALSSIDGTHFTVDLTVGGAPALGNATLYRAVKASVQSHGWANTTYALKFWTEVSLAFSRLLGPSVITSEFSGAEQLSIETAQNLSQPVQYTLSGGFARYHLGTVLRSLVPVAHARSWLLRAKLSWTSVFGSVSLESVGVDSRQAATKRPASEATS